MTGYSRAIAAVAAVAALALTTSFAPAAVIADAADGGIEELLLHEALEATFDADGELTEARVRTSIDVRGDGPVTLELPARPGLRRTDGFAQPSVTDGTASFELDLDGAVRRDTVVDVDADDLPLLLRARYELDGEPVRARDLAGASGEATIRLLLRNLTAEGRYLVHTTADRPVVSERDVAVPLAARVVAELDGSWSAVEVDGGNVAPLGRSRSATTWSGTILQPLTDDGEVEVEIRGVVDDATLPEIVVDAAPLYRVEGSELARLVDLLDDRRVDDALLAFGLAGLAEGLGELRGGLEELTAGLEELEAGAAELANGIAEAAEGASEFAVGLGELAAGVAALADGLGELAAGARALAEGSAAYAAGVTEASRQVAIPDPGDLGDLAALPVALRGLAGGARELEAGARTLADGLDEPLGDLDLTGVAEVVEALVANAEALVEIADALADLDEQALVANLHALADGLAETVADLDAVLASLPEGTPEEVVATIEGARDVLAGTEQTVRENAQAIAAELAEVGAQLGALAAGLAELATDLDGVDLDDLAALTEVPRAVEGLADGIGELAGGLEEVAAGAETGFAELADGLDGLAQLDDALAELAVGARELADGAAGVAEGTGQSAAGAGELARGTRELEGAGGALAGGLFEASGGARELRGGVGGAAEGGEGLTEGAGALGEEGVAPLLVQVEDASEATSLDLATLRALERRAEEDALVLGAPEGAQTSASYRLVLDAGADARTGTATAQLVGAIALLVLVGGLEALRRRIVSV